MEKAGTLANILRRGIASWLTAAAILYGSLSPSLRNLAGLESLQAMSFPLLALLTLACFLLLTLAAARWDFRRWERRLLAAAGGILCILGLAANFSWGFLGFCLAAAIVLLIYARFGWNPSAFVPETLRLAGKGSIPACCVLALVFFLLVSLWTVGRVQTFSSPSYDFGIFSQMFYHMRTTLLPNTTLERDGLLSHLAVHMSPIYYLLLPFYCLAPYPETLQVLQAAVLASAVVPLWLLCRELGFTPWLRTAFCALLLLYPAYAGGTGYDIHENAFLTPLLLWLFLAMVRRKLFCTFLFALLTLLIKEDTAMYVAVAGLYLALSRALKKDWHWSGVGALLLILSLGYFLLVTGFLSRYGDGVMTYRYQNFLYDGSGSLAALVKAVLLCPIKAVYECADSEKLLYLVQTMLPLLFLPLLTRRYERYLLLIPYILMNLLSDYPYQHDLYFQYGFGSTAFLFFLTALNVADFRKKHGALLLALVVSAGCFSGWILPKALYYPRLYRQNASSYAQIRQVLHQIPEEAAVTATTFYTAPLSQRAVLYDLRYCSQAHLLESDCVVLNPTAEQDLSAYGGLEAFTALLEENGFTLTFQLPGRLLIFFADSA